MDTIALYICDVIYRCGGTESYAANMIEVLQKILPDSSITVITELHPHTEALSSDSLADRLNAAYGLEIAKQNLQVRYIRAESSKTRIQYLKFHRQIRNITGKFDLFIYCSRGLLSSRAKKSIAVIHFPTEPKMQVSFSRKFPFLKWFAAKTDRDYLASYTCFLPNSQFTASWLKKMWHVDDSRISVLYPPVTPVSAPQTAKENIILVCSRIEKSKKIEDLIRAYLSSDFLVKEYTLVIAGSTQSENADYIQSLQKHSDAVQFIFNADRETIANLYARAAFFWHAKGFGLKESEHPYQMEHFGITTVEAMSAGCIPVVINSGGQKEIVTGNEGLRWDTLEQLTQYTENIAKDKDLMRQLSQDAAERSKLYTKDAYMRSLQRIIADKLQ